MSTLTAEKEEAIREYFRGRHIPAGLGTKEEACSIAGIQLALTGELTDEIPECMSPVIGRWIIRVQDKMPDAMRNSDEWRDLLPLAAGTGREREQERLEILLDWMWSVVLPTVQPIADKRGFGEKWRTMCEQRTAAADARWSAAAAAAAAAARWSAAAAADARWSAAAAAADAADAAAADAAADAADAAAAAAAADAADAADAAAARENFWQQVNPPALLRRLIDVN